MQEPTVPVHLDIDLPPARWVIGQPEHPLRTGVRLAAEADAHRLVAVPENHLHGLGRRQVQLHDELRPDPV